MSASLARARAVSAERRALGLLPKPLAPAAAAAAARLHRQIAALPAHAVPCVAAADPAPWTSEHPADAEWAAAECQACPVLPACERFGVESRAMGVVLAGRRWHPGTPNKISKTTPAPAGTTERTNP